MPSRYFIQLAYEGTAYHGWQIQPGSITVQQVLQEKMAMLLRSEVDTLGCGRTDTGVHAKMFFAHWDGPDDLPGGDEKFVYHLNSVLPRDIAVQRFFKVPADAHARFDATFRRYEYHIVRTKDAFAQHRAWELRDALDVAAMNKAAALLLNHRDFSCFEKSGGQNKTSLCTVTQAEWFERGNRLIFHVAADRFLRNMVRAIVGTLIDVGRKKITVEDVQRILDSGDRSEAGASVPAHGLYLAEIRYPIEYGLNV